MRRKIAQPRFIRVMDGGASGIDKGEYEIQVVEPDGVVWAYEPSEGLFPSWYLDDSGAQYVIL